MADKFIPHGHPKREENLSQFLEGNHPEVPSVAYHGGPRDVGSFNTKFGSWFSEKPSLANEYGSTEGGSVYPVHLSIKRPIEFVHAEQRKKIGEIISHALGGAEDLSSDQIEKAKSLIGRLRQTHGEEPKALFEFWRNDPNVAEFFRTLGYDGITAFEKSDRSNKTWAALYPQQIKSATGNQGTFDPNDPDITKADGGSVDDQDQGITAYHGSPHEFENFDISKIGTGEGAQAYGHGLYFAEAEPVAREYRNMLAPPSNPTIDGKPIDRALLRDVALDAGIESPGGAINNLQSRLRSSDDVANYSEKLSSIDLEDLRKTFPSVAKEVETEKKIFEELVKRGLNIERPAKGHMYEVRINAHPDHFLDWDKPLSEQSEYVQNALREHTPLQRARPYSPNTKGEDIYYRNTQGIGGKAIASQELHRLGIKGIKYLDQGSRGAGEGSRNYVVFDDKLVTIKRRYAEGGKVESYPLRNHHDWEEAHDYEKTGGKLGYESPSEYLKEVKPLNMDHDDKKLIHHFKKQMKKGEKLDPVAIYPDGHPNGRHRAHAAKDLGIKKIPVVKWPEKKKGGGPVVDQALMVISRRRAPPGTPG
jgi:hypothetical protein